MPSFETRSECTMLNCGGPEGEGALGFRLLALRQLVQHVRGFVHPAALAVGLGPHFRSSRGQPRSVHRGGHGLGITGRISRCRPSALKGRQHPHRVNGLRPRSLAQSCTWRRSFAGNWDSSSVTGGHAGPAHEGDRRTMNMHADEESDEGIVPMKRAFDEAAVSAHGRDRLRGWAYRIRTLMCREKIHLFDKSREFGFKRARPDRRGLMGE
jgi:hypothetical protein